MATLIFCNGSNDARAIGRELNATVLLWEQTDDITKFLRGGVNVAVHGGKPTSQWRAPAGTQIVFTAAFVNTFMDLVCAGASLAQYLPTKIVEGARTNRPSVFDKG